VAPPRKQASTGSNATVALAIQRGVAAFWFSRDRDRCMEFGISQGKLS